ncbi:hypothetical protein [Nocardia sp. NPDC051570]|uniref:hypothetical protein n=1 Tax=Nocardia sp. NPDC051570 TaxID=3364324 RepID=UPI00378B2588
MTPEARILAEAFMDDPLMTYFWPRPERRQRALPHFWHSRVESRRRYGIVDTTSDNDGLVSVVLWERAGVTTPIAKPFSLFRALGTALPRALAASRQIESLRPRTPHLYIAAGGTLPRAHGKGLISELVTSRIETSDVDVFLVATNPKSAALGEHLGFRTTKELTIGDHTVMKAMLRKVV